MLPPVSQRCPLEIFEGLCHTDDATLAMGPSSSHMLNAFHGVDVLSKDQGGV